MSEKNTITMNNIKPMPAYLLSDYPYQASGEVIADPDTLQSSKVLYEIKCSDCEMSIRAQGDKVRHTYDLLMNSNGCIGCNNRSLTIRKIDIK